MAKGNDQSALILVDIQFDFLPGGALMVPEGDAVLEPIRSLMAHDLFGLKVATQDWHPAGHISFASSHPGASPLEVIELHGHDQVLWPDHCIQGSGGARLHPGIDWRGIAAVIRKGMAPDTDSYSGFRNNWNPEGDRPATGLEGYLRELGIEEVFICGLARDYCVRWTAEDAATAGFATHVIWDLTRPVDPEGDAELRTDLEESGVTLVEAASLLSEMEARSG